MNNKTHEIFIGLEIHMQLLTETKIFCSCRNSFGDPPNTNICPICLGYPGVLPVLNEEAVKKSYIMCRALNCTLSEKAVFDRKNYFYPDLPKNYQITQFEYPFGTDGYLDNEVDGEIKRIRIHEAHLEEDAGKMIHEGAVSYCDYNRACTPLLEVVTEPDFKTAVEVELFLQNFRRVIRYLGAGDGNMEEGSMRCDANISVNHPGMGLGRKVEIKNLNSSRHARLALQYEEHRQVKMLKAGEVIAQETRLWNEDKKRTESMRTKEDANDYRYFPEPDLPPYYPMPDFLAEIDRAVVELPLAGKKRLAAEYSLTDDTADFITEEKARADFFEEACRAGADPRDAASWLKGDVAKVLNREKIDIASSPLDIKRFTDLLKMLEAGKINGQTAKKVLDIVILENRDPEEIVKAQNWEIMEDTDELSAIIDKVIADNAAAAGQIKDGDKKPLGFLIGQVMKLSGGKADPKKVSGIITEKLS